MSENVQTRIKMGDDLVHLNQVVVNYRLTAPGEIEYSDVSRSHYVVTEVRDDSIEVAPMAGYEPNFDAPRREITREEWTDTIEHEYGTFHPWRTQTAADGTPVMGY
jgi:hypothetical protein